MNAGGRAGPAQLLAAVRHLLRAILAALLATLRPRNPNNLWVGFPLSPAAARREEARLTRLRRELDDLALGGELMRRPLLDLTDPEIERLTPLVERLARAWVKPVDITAPARRRTQLHMSRTLRRNLPRYAGRVLDLHFRPRLVTRRHGAEPARLLVIGDVSRSMADYVGVLLYFFHALERHFEVDSWVFSNQATHATPFMGGPGEFRQKVGLLARHAVSWNAGTLLGSSLQEITSKAHVDEDTYVILVTDGQVAVHAGEHPKIQAGMGFLRQRARRVLCLTPTRELAERGHEYARLCEELPRTPPERIVRWDPQWQLRVARFGTVARDCHELHLARTVGDLCRLCERLVQDANREGRRFKRWHPRPNPPTPPHSAGSTSR